MGVLQAVTLAEQFLGIWNVDFDVTLRLFGALPEERWDWRPHPKSRTVGDLCAHIVEIEDWISRAMEEEAFRFGQHEVRPVESRDGLLAWAAEVHERAVTRIRAFDDGKMERPVRWVRPDGVEIMNLPVAGYLHTVLRGHVIHHQGQLSVYLRLLDVPVPYLRGPSADVPFAAAR